MQQSLLVQAALTEALWVVGGAVLGLVVTLAAVVFTAQGRRVPSAGSVAGVGLVALATLLGAAAGGLNPDRTTGALAAGVIPLLGAFAAVPLAGLTLLAAAALGAQAPREPRRAIPLLALVALTAGASLIEGQAGGNVVFGLVRAAVIAGTGALMAVSAIGPDRQHAGVAGVAWALVVGLVEAAERGLVAAFALSNTIRLVPVDKRAEAIDTMLAHVAAEVPWSWLAVSLAMIAAVLAMAGGDRRPGPLSGLAWLPVIPALLGFGIPGRDALVAAALAGPPPVIDRTPDSPGG